MARALPKISESRHTSSLSNAINPSFFPASCLIIGSGNSTVSRLRGCRSVKSRRSWLRISYSCGEACGRGPSRSISAWLCKFGDRFLPQCLAQAGPSLEGAPGFFAMKTGSERLDQPAALLGAFGEKTSAQLRGGKNASALPLARRAVTSAGAQWPAACAYRTA